MARFPALAALTALLQACAACPPTAPAAPSRRPDPSWSRSAVVDVPAAHLLGDAAALFTVKPAPDAFVDLHVSGRPAYLWRWNTSAGWLAQGWLRDEHRLLEAAGGAAFAVHGPGATVSFGMRAPRLPRVGRIFSRLDGPRLVPVESPVPGSPLRLLVRDLGRPTRLVVELEGKGVVDGRLEHASVVAFTIPRDVEPGERRLRVVADGRPSAWARLEIAAPAQVDIRRQVARQAREALIRIHGPETASRLTLAGPWAPVPPGTALHDASDDREPFVVKDAGTWSFVAFDRTSYPVSPFDTRLICFYPPRDPIVDFPHGPLYRLGGGGPLPRDGNEGGAFEADGEPRPVDAGGPPAPAPGPVVSTPDGPATFSSGFTGRISTVRCPRGRTSAVIVIQLVEGQGADTSGDRKRPDFDDLARKVRDGLPPDVAQHHLEPKDFLPDPLPQGFDRDHVKLDLDRTLKPLLERIKAGDNGECCTDVTVILLSHGKASGANDDHPLAFYCRQGGNVYKGSTGNRNRWNSTSDFLKKIAEVLGDGCIPVTVIDHSCYSGRTTANGGRRFNDALGGHPNHKISLVATSGYNQVSGGTESDTGEQSNYFFDALFECLADLANDANGDRRVSLQEALECAQRKTNDKSKGGADRDQNPEVWPR